ncbi:MAG: hypothetical protein HQM14_11690 [SAR324 cluster bacterium]|nr:hypothetical protein [SAR324 cluster bacterium]
MRNIIPQYRFIRKIGFFWIAGMIAICSSSFADDHLPRVLILNSSAYIQKYSQVEEEFNLSLSGHTIVEELNIGSKWISEEKIEEKIYDSTPELILCIGSKAYLLAKKFTKNTPLLFILGIHRNRFALTDKTYVIESELSPVSQLTMFRFFFPGLIKVGVLYSKYNQQWFSRAQSSAKEVGIELAGIYIGETASFREGLEALLPKIDALWLISDPIVLTSREQVKAIFRESHVLQKPVFAYDRIFGSFGATLIISADVVTMAKQASQMAFNILANKSTLQKKQIPAGSHIAIHLDKIKQYQLLLNPRALSSVNEYIHNSK